ncbi:MAG: acyl-CoA thioesterase [bacterium]
MAGKKVSSTAVVMSQIMQPQDANMAGNVHGGNIMKLIDNAAAVVCLKHTKNIVVTASIDRLSFHNPVFIGDMLTVKASLNMTGNTSMEVGVRVETENLISEQVAHVASAYLTFVSLDKNGKPLPVPPLIPETADEIRRNQEAQDRRRVRKAERIKEEQHQQRDRKTT